MEKIKTVENKDTEAADTLRALGGYINALRSLNRLSPLHEQFFDKVKKAYESGDKKFMRRVRAELLGWIKESSPREIDAIKNNISECNSSIINEIFSAKEDKRLSKIMKSNKITTVSDYKIVENKARELAETDNSNNDIDILNDLLSAYHEKHIKK